MDCSSNSQPSCDETSRLSISITSSISRNASSLMDWNSSPIRRSPSTSPTHQQHSSDDNPCQFTPTRRKRYEVRDPKASPTSRYWPKSPSPLHVSDTEPEIYQVTSLLQTSTPTKALESVDSLSQLHQSGEVFAEPLLEPILEPLHASQSLTSSSEGVSSGSSSTEENCCTSSSSMNSDDSSDADQISEDDTSQHNAGEEKLFAGSNLTIDEAVVSVMNLFIYRKLDKVTLSAHLKCLLKFLPRPNAMPKTIDSLLKYVRSFSPLPPENIHYYCSVCLHYLGVEEKLCTLCNGECHKFYQLSLAHQIRNFFENYALADEIDKYSATRSSRQRPGYVSDLLDGTEFKKSCLQGQYDLSLMGHTDGVSISKSSNCSLWPLEFVICQLPPNLRYKFVIVSGVWVDMCKPSMNTYLKPFVNEIVEIRERGVKWVHPISKQEHVTHVTVPCFTVDAPVRACLQNILGVGGKCSCNMCEQKTLRLPAEPVVPGQKKKARKRVFTFQNDVCLRSGLRMKEQAKQTKRNEALRRKEDPVKGVKGSTVLAKLPGCDVGTSVFPEYMHLILCLVKHFFHVWFETDGPWSLKAQRDKINSFLTSVRVPDFITRIPRSTDCYSQWKANELRTFVLYLSLVIFAECMKPIYFQHWLLFVSALTLLLQESVSQIDINKSEILLKMFLRDFERLYDRKFSTYYLHNVRHLPMVVQRHGPLWSNSAFQLESFNGSLRCFIHGTKNQGQELINNIKLATGFEILKMKCCTDGGSNQRNLGGELRNELKGYSFSTLEKELMSQFHLRKPIKAFCRCVINRKVYTSFLYTRQKRRNNYTVCYLNARGEKDYGEVKFYCEDVVSEMLAIVRHLVVEHCRVMHHHLTNTVVDHIIPITETSNFVAVPIENILFKTARVGQFVCVPPNSYEVNL